MIHIHNNNLRELKFYFKDYKGALIESDDEYYYTLELRLEYWAMTISNNFAMLANWNLPCLEMSIPQLDVRVTKYLSKPNAETTKYFTQDSYDIDELEQQVQENTADISLALNEVSSLQINKESCTDHAADISNLQASINSKESSSDHAADISNIHASIASIPINPYEGLFYSRYANQFVIVEFNYGIGNMIFWPDGDGNNSYNTSINNVDSGHNVQLSSNIKSLTLPWTIKKLNSNGTVNSIKNKLYYTLDPPSSSCMNFYVLKTITVLPDVWKIELNCLGAPNLSSLNLFNGLQILSISNAYNINYLKIPSLLMNVIFQIVYLWIYHLNLQI